MKDKTAFTDYIIELITVVSLITALLGGIIIFTIIGWIVFHFITE